MRAVLFLRINLILIYVVPLRGLNRLATTAEIPPINEGGFTFALMIAGWKQKKKNHFLAASDRNPFQYSKP